MKIFHLVDDEGATRVLYSSPDKSLIEELMYDEFLDEVMYEHYYSFDENLKKEGNIEVINEAWNRLMTYYADYVYIAESELI